jgi:hypothetical protein
MYAIGSSKRRVLNQSALSSVANSTVSRLRRRPRPDRGPAAHPPALPDLAGPAEFSSNHFVLMVHSPSRRKSCRTHRPAADGQFDARIRQPLCGADRQMPVTLERAGGVAGADGREVPDRLTRLARGLITGSTSAGSSAHGVLSGGSERARPCTRRRVSTRINPTVL